MTKITKDQLEGLTIQELDSLAALVQVVRKETALAHAQSAKEKIAEIARAAGYASVQDLFGFGGSAPTERKTRKGSGEPIAAKYAHPENPSITWSGRGRKPVWFADWLESGKSGDDLLIE